MRYLFLRLITTWSSDQIRWVRVENDHLVANGCCEEITDLPQAGANEKVILCVPGVDVLLTEAELPRLNRQRLLKAVPYALEDQLVDSVDDLHFALGSQDETGKYPVAVVNREQMTNWLGLLEKAGITPDIIIPDTLALPVVEHTWSLLLEDGKVLVRTGHCSGFAVEQENLSVLLSHALQTAAIRPDALDVFQTQDTEMEQAPIYKDMGVVFNRLNCEEDSTLFLLRHYFASKLDLNLLQGEFSRREKLARHIKPWIPAAALLLIWLVLQVGVDVYRYVRLSNEDAALQQQIEELFKKTFPEARLIKGSEQTIIENRLASLRKGKGKGAASLQKMLTASAPILMANKDLELQTFRYRDGRLDLELTIKDFQALEKLEQDLEQQHGWEVEIQSSRPKDNKVESRLQIRTGAT